MTPYTGQTTGEKRVLPTERQVQRQILAMCGAAEAGRPIPPLTVSDRQRFERQRQGRNERGCWIWTGKSTAGKYRLFPLGRDKYLAHRIAWYLRYGQIPDGQCVCHRCDNPLCTNPSHLFLGTHLANMRDMFSKGRNRSVGLKGEKQNGAKLTEKDVVAIRADTRPQRIIAVEYGVYQSTVSYIKSRKLWAHL